MERYDYYDVPDDEKDEHVSDQDLPDEHADLQDGEDGARVSRDVPGEQAGEQFETKEEQESSADTRLTPQVYSGEFNQNPELESYPEAQVTGDANDVNQLNDAMDSLESTQAGKEIGKEIRENNVGIEFGKTEEGAVAQFDPQANEITITEDLRGEDSSVLAAHLAHEGTHVQWSAQGIDHDSIDQEYHSEKNESAVWDEIKDDKTDDQCDFISNEIAQGEADAKLHIRQRYPGLPDW